MYKSNQLEQYFKNRELEWESLCCRCGGCCGAFDDPCRHLKKDGGLKYYCEIYPDRFGERKAVSGEKFECVKVNEIINSRWRNDYLCVYKEIIKSPWLR